MSDTPQSLTIAQVLDLSRVGSDSWTHQRCKAVTDAGVPDDARLWLDVRAAGTVVREGVVLLFKTFEWHVHWHPEQGPPIHAHAEGSDEPTAFEALLRALG